MLFSTPLFIFLFFPVVALVYASIPTIRAKNFWLLLSSLFFYSWGEIEYVLMLILSVLINYKIGIAIENSGASKRKRAFIITGIAFNIGLLAFFKYLNFGINILSWMLQFFGVKWRFFVDLALPLGISFFTFHALSYLIDIYRRKQPAASNPLDVALYIFFFPQLIAGPILRWDAIAPQLVRRTHSVEKCAAGVRRFVTGLAKKVLIANSVAVPADQIFSLRAGQLSTAHAWFGAICYLLQIYFDFSGYSDMAIGMGKIFGFEFPENFNFPYISQSMREFWRRWHISLSTWFRDYLYFPLGGSQISQSRTFLNLFVVFFLCGLWHGASMTYVVWGLYHGLFLILERTPLGSLIERMPRALRHLYVVLVVVVGWVIFRAEDFQIAANCLLSMAGLNNVTEPQPWMYYAGPQTICAVIAGIIFSTPVSQKLSAKFEACSNNWPLLLTVGSSTQMAGILILFFLSIARLAAGTYNPFIYFRF